MSEALGITAFYIFIAAIIVGSHCSLLLQNYSVSFVGITMAEAFYILIGFLIMAAIIVMAVLYLENHS